MKRLTKVHSVISAAALLVAMLAVPASADVAHVDVCHGTVNVYTDDGNGLTFDTPQGFDWDFSGTCTDGAWTATIVMSGTGAFGSCGSWTTPPNGSGSVHYVGRPDPDIALINVQWTVNSGPFVVTGNHDHGGLGVFVGVGQVSGGRACLTGAKAFGVSVIMTYY